MGVIYWVISAFGSAGQAGFGIGSRIMQSIFMPGMAIAFAAGPIAGQNYGAGRGARVRETFAKAVMLNTVVMVLVTVFLQWRPEALVGFFTHESDATEVGATFLRTISWTFIAQGVVFTRWGLFQGLGNTRPAMLSSGDSARGLRAARDLGVEAGRLPPRAAVVRVRRDCLDAGGRELFAAAPPVQSTTGRHGTPSRGRAGRSYGGRGRRDPGLTARRVTVARCRRRAPPPSRRSSVRSTA